jgi:hypothetical protein
MSAADGLQYLNDNFPNISQLTSDHIWELSKDGVRPCLNLPNCIQQSVKFVSDQYICDVKAGEG